MSLTLLATAELWNRVADAYDEELAEQFAPFAQAALERTPLPPDAKVLDVACGTGTLALLAAPKVGSVLALDVAENMIAHLQRRTTEAGLHNLEARVADARDLDLKVDTFDAAFSMFGLIFFPDRVGSLKAVHRVLKPGGQLVLGCWVPPEEIPALDAMLGVVKSFVPAPTEPPEVPPMTTSPVIKAELDAAGFVDVALDRVTASRTFPSMEVLAASAVRSSVHFTLLKDALDEGAWTELEDGLLEALNEALGEDPTLHYAAWLAHAKRPG